MGQLACLFQDDAVERHIQQLCLPQIMQVAEECTVKHLASLQDNGRKQLPGQATGNGGSGQGSADSATPQSWVAMRSDEGEAMHRLRHDEGTHVSLSGAYCSPLRPYATMLRSHDAAPL